MLPTLLHIARLSDEKYATPLGAEALVTDVNVGTFHTGTPEANDNTYQFVPAPNLDQTLPEDA